MKKLLVLALMSNVSVASAEFQGNIELEKNVLFGFQYNFENGLYPKISIEQDEKFAVGLGFSLKMLQSDVLVGYDFENNKPFSDFSSYFIEKVDKFGFGIGGTKRVYISKNPNTENSIIPKLLLTYSF